MLKMEDEKESVNKPWDTCREVPVIEDEHTPWKLIKFLKFISLCLVFIFVFGTAVCSKASFLLLITFAHDDTKVLPGDHKPVALLCIGCALITPSVLLFLKSIWKACYKTSKIPRKGTVALVLFFELIVSSGTAILTVVAMPHFDIVTNVTILSSVALVSTFLQVIAQCSAKQNNRFLVPSITALLLIMLGYILFGVLYILKDPNDTKMIIWVGLAIGASVLVSFNWWESYFRLIGENSNSDRLKNLCRDMTRCQNLLHIISSLLRIAVTAAVVGGYVPLAKMDWSVVTSIPSHETKIIAITIGVQLISSVLCHWFSGAACKMHAMRRCFIIPLYLASLGVMVLLIVPVIVYYQDYKISLNGTATNFSSYCTLEVIERTRDLNITVFPELVLDVTHTLCFLDMSNIWDIGILTGFAVSWWMGLILATLHIWFLNMFRIQRTQDLFMRRLYDGAFIEQSLLLNTRFDIQTKAKVKNRRPYETVMLYLCATMWHETWDEMMNLVISIFRLDRYRPKINPKINDFTFETHVYFDDAFEDIEGTDERHLNKYAQNLVEILKEVYSIFSNVDSKFFREQRYIPEQRIVRTPYGGRVIVTMPHGNILIVHFKDKDLIRHKKRWSQVMYLYYLLGYKLMSKYYSRWQKGDEELSLKAEVMKEKHNTYLLALDGDTDFQPSAVMLLIDRLRMYPRVGAACGRIHPTGSGPAVWFQKFEYAVSHWLQKTCEHVIGCVLCSPGCFSLFRAAALMDDNVMKRYATKSTEASHYVQYDQGEDRWLCTLLLKQGWRVEYNAASDAYTNAPEEFKELYNQRRRWGPSTLANIVDLLGATKQITKKNPSISKLFMFYQLFAIISAILAPATICLLIAGSLAFIFNIHSAAALVMAVIPPAIFLFLCFKVKSDTQIAVAGVLSVIYAFLMLVVTMSIIGAMVKDQTILTPSSIFVVAMALIYIITAIMHPQEFHLVFYGFLYIICIPSAYMLLIIYAMVNLNNVSWGTRETKPPPGSGAPAAATNTRQSTSQKVKSTCQRMFSWAKCCKKNTPSAPRQPPPESSSSCSDSMMYPEAVPETDGPMNTIVDAVEPRHSAMALAFSLPPQCWVTNLQETVTEMRLREESLDQEETEFFKELVDKYLKPLADDKEQKKKMAADLVELRNKINFAFFMLNALWLSATFTLQVFEAAFALKVPKVTMELDFTGEMVQIDPVAFMFILGFATSVIIQFLAMLSHRIYTLIHFIAFMDTESKEVKEEKPKKTKKKYLKGKKQVEEDPTVGSVSTGEPSDASTSSSLSGGANSSQTDSVDSDSDESDYDTISNFYPGVQFDDGIIA